MPVTLTSSSICCSYHEIKGESWHLQVIKVPFKTTNYFNSTMMASFLPVKVSKKSKQTKKNMSFIAVYHSNKS